ncbi:MAG TPA: YdcF family protein [Candidatus Saccharimonadia bacterium]|nr:YdcF family protein [Candidatus Saccharimonadia bacterium]
MKRFFVALVILAGAVGALAVTFFFGIGYYLSPQDPLAKADAVVAISGGETKTRTAEAIKLYQDGYAAHLIFSGAALDPNSPSNAKTMGATARDAGVPSAAIALDELANNTRENANGVAAIIRDKHLHSIILVTSPYHQRRAYLEFRRALGQDFVIINHSSYDGEWRRSHWWATPTSRSLTFAELQKVLYELASGNPQ